MFQTQQVNFRVIAAEALRVVFMRSLFIDEGVQFNLGGDVSLRAYQLPGHMMAELGWRESSTRTLILGDAITGLD